MNAEFWPVITMGIVILIAIATSNRSLRREMGERIDGLGERIDRLEERIDGVGRKVSERLGEVRERLGRVEGMLEAVLRMRTGKGRGDEKHDPALPRS